MRSSPSLSWRHKQLTSPAHPSRWRACLLWPTGFMGPAGASGPMWRFSTPSQVTKTCHSSLSRSRESVRQLQVAATSQGFRVDRISFRSETGAPLFDGSHIQAHELASGTRSQLPARKFYVHSSGMRFHGAAWDYSYAMYRSFRIERHVYVIYTDASMFLDQ